MSLNESTFINFLPLEAVKPIINIIAALGGIIFLYLIFVIIRTFIDRKKYKKIEEINEKMDKIINLLKNKK